MPHAAIIGQTGTGKTHAARSLARCFIASGVKTLALHKPREPWERAAASWQTPDPATFLPMFWKAKGCACFMELADAGVSKWDTEFHKCFSQGRHEGHRCFFLSQRAATVHPTIRENCSSLYLFAVPPAGARLWAEEFNDEELLKAVSLPPHIFFYKANRYTPAILRKFPAL